MGEHADREFLAFENTIRVLRAVSFCHSSGVQWVSAGRANAQVALMAPAEESILNTANVLGRLSTLGLASRKTSSDDVERYRLKDGVVTVVLRSEPECDVCKVIFEHRGAAEIKTAFADARTQTGRWGFVCREHFVSEGCFLGMGRGQILRAESLTPVKTNHI